MPACTHLKQIHKVAPHTQGCEECLKTGDTWVHLRLCICCGHVGCCDSSKNRHATKHSHATEAPASFESLEPGEDWMSCYVDEVDHGVSADVAETPWRKLPNKPTRCFPSWTTRRLRVLRHSGNKVKSRPARILFDQGDAISWRLRRARRQYRNRRYFARRVRAQGS